MENSRNHVPLSSASERLKYQIHHHDMMGNYGAAWALVCRSPIYVTPADVSPELAAHIRYELAHLHPNDDGESAQHWREEPAQ